MAFDIASAIQVGGNNMAGIGSQYGTPSYSLSGQNQYLNPKVSTTPNMGFSGQNYSLIGQQSPPLNMAGIGTQYGSQGYSLTGQPVHNQIPNIPLQIQNINQQSQQIQPTQQLSNMTGIGQQYGSQGYSLTGQNNLPNMGIFGNTIYSNPIQDQANKNIQGPTGMNPLSSIGNFGNPFIANNVNNLFGISTGY